jgi:hypothetical protein
MQGREIYEHALADPDSLAELCTTPGELAECERVLYVANELYDQKTGGEMEESCGGYAETDDPGGVRLGDDDVLRLFPRLVRIHRAG